MKGFTENIMAAEGLVTQGTMASETMIFNSLRQSDAYMRQ